MDLHRQGCVHAPTKTNLAAAHVLELAHERPDGLPGQVNLPNGPAIADLPHAQPEIHRMPRYHVGQHRHACPAGDLLCGYRSAVEPRLRAAHSQRPLWLPLTT